MAVPDNVADEAGISTCTHGLLAGSPGLAPDWATGVTSKAMYLSASSTCTV